MLTCARNRGELSEGWYDPATLQKATTSAQDETERNYREPGPNTSRAPHEDAPRVRKSKDEEQSDSDDSIGPELPGQEGRSRTGRVGPSIPNMQDLELKKGNLTFL